MRALGLLILGRFLGGLGYQMIVLEGITEIYAKTHSVLMTGVLGVALFIPTLLLNYFAGLWADRSLSKGFIYFCLQSGFALACGLLYFFHTPTVTVLVFFLLSTVRTLRTPFFYFLARECGTGQGSEVRAARLSQLSMLSWQLPLVLGPFFYSALRSTFSAGLVAFGFSAVAALMAWPVKSEAQAGSVVPESQPLRVSSFFEANKVFFEASAFDVLVIGSLSFGSLIPFFLERMHSDPNSIGYVRAAASLGSLLCLWFFDHQIFRKRRQNVFLASVFLACAVVYAIPSATTLVGLLLLAMCFGFLDGFSILYRDFLIYTSAKETFGRVSSIGQVFNSASEDLGEFRAGLLGNWLGPEMGLRAGAIIGAATGLGILLLRFAGSSSKSLAFSKAVSKRDLHT